VGPYTYPNFEFLKEYKEGAGQVSTAMICAHNGLEVMLESYAAIKMADAITNSKSEHTMMVIEDATVVRKADGSIDPQESYIIIQDQAAGVSTTSEFNVFEEDGIKVHYTGRLNVKWSFLKLFQSNYIPVTTKEFAGVEPYAKPEVKSSKEVTDMESLYTTEITSVYPMSMIKVMAKKSTGRETELFHFYVDRYDVGTGLARLYKMSGVRLDIDAEVKKLVAGDYTITLEVTDSTGTVFNLGTVQYSK
jgi:hypothetical protein